MRFKVLLASLLAICLVQPAGEAQVAKESDATAIAGVLGGGFPDFAEWKLRSGGHEVLFASLEGELYATREHEDHEAAVEEEPGGCEDEGGPGRFCLQVIDPGGAIVCEATRPAPPPGWQRDPRLACYLPANGGNVEYTLRVSLTGPEGTCPAVAVSTSHPNASGFLLNVSLRGVAPSGVQLHQAAARSRNRF